MTVLSQHVFQYLTDVHTGWFGRFSDDLGTGLTLFFALSGFLLYRPFAASIVSGEPRPSLRRYSVQRVRRIYPGYLAVFVLTSFVFGAAYQAGAPVPSGPEHPVGYLTDPVTIVVNLALVQTYVPGQLLTGIGPAWSLTTEIAFYALMPLAAVAAARRARRGGRPVVAALLPPAAFVAVGLAASTALKVWSSTFSADELRSHLWGQDLSSVFARSVVTNAALFGMGMLAAAAHVLLTRGLAVPRPAVLATVVLALVALGGPLTGHGNFYADTAAAFGLATLVLLITTRWTAAATLLETRPLTGLGRISYSIYLWHMPVMWFLFERGWTPGDRSPAGGVLALLLVTAITLPLAALTYRYVERPGMTFRQAPR